MAPAGLLFASGLERAPDVLRSPNVSACAHPTSSVRNPIAVASHGVFLREGLGSYAPSAADAVEVHRAIGTAGASPVLCYVRITRSGRGATWSFLVAGDLAFAPRSHDQIDHRAHIYCTLAPICRTLFVSGSTAGLASAAAERPAAVPARGGHRGVWLLLGVLHCLLTQSLYCYYIVSLAQSFLALSCQCPPRPHRGLGPGALGLVLRSMLVAGLQLVMRESCCAAAVSVPGRLPSGDPGCTALPRTGRRRKSVAGAARHPLVRQPPFGTPSNRRRSPPGVGPVGPSPSPGPNGPGPPAFPSSNRLPRTGQSCGRYVRSGLYVSISSPPLPRWGPWRPEARPPATFVLPDQLVRETVTSGRTQDILRTRVRCMDPGFAAPTARQPRGASVREVANLTGFDLVRNRNLNGGSSRGPALLFFSPPGAESRW